MRKLLLNLALVLTTWGLFAQKTVYLPNDFTNDPVLSGQWSWSKSYQSDNFVVFWGNVVGTDPANYSNPDLRFDPQDITDLLEASYAKFIDDIGFISDASSTNLGQYKIIVMMNDTWTGGGPSGWAFGGAYDGVIGAMWVHPGATQDGYVLSHEFAHSLQSMVSIQENPGGGFSGWEPAGFFWEAHANYMRCLQYPQFAGDDLPRWMGTSSFHLSSTRHHYGTFKWLMHLQSLDGVQMVNRLWNESNANEHPVVTLRRLKGWNQSQLNSFMFDYVKREVTCDYPAYNFGQYMRDSRNNLKNNEPHYMWRFHTILDQVAGSQDRYVVPDAKAPQDYGYNIIPLHPVALTPCGDRIVHIKFKGHTEVNSSAGWRYGFVAVSNGGTQPRYSPVYSANDGEVTFEMNVDETELYFVVMGAPTSHTSYVWEPGWPKIKRYPYELRIEHAIPEGYQSGYRSQYKTSGGPHSNGGGWVASSASVAASVYVGPDAIVLGSANLSGNARIEGRAWVENASVSGNVVIKDNANVWGGTYTNSAQISEYAILNNCTVSGSAIVKGNAMEWGVTLGGSIVVGGDAEIGSCSSGVYLQVPHGNNGRTPCDGQGAGHSSNQDVNAAYSLFSGAQMAFGDPVTCEGGGVTEINLALGATPSTSHVSPWETLGAVNDGYVPASSSDNSNGAYGNWDGEENFNTWNWVEYDLGQQYEISATHVYWWNDGAGIEEPYSTYVEYWNGSSWTNAGNIGVALNQWNILTGSFTTDRIRIHFIGNKATGILEWQVWGQSPGARTVQNLNASLPAKAVSIYPNPAGAHFTVNIRGFDKEQKVELAIYDMAGRQVYTRSVGQVRELTLDIGQLGLKENMYLLKITGQQQVFSTKLLIDTK